ncbi:unnamed protein product, partial [Adineta steineri]
MTVTTELSSWDCSECSRTLNHGEFRFTCTVCDDYDLCETCVGTLNPPHPHKLIRELAYRHEDIIIAYTSATMASNIEIATDMYRDRYCLGVRDVDETNPSLYADTYSWLTYETIGTRSKNFGNGLRNIIQSRDYLGICAKNRPEWVITDFACMFQSIISVPIYTLFNDRELTHVINNTKLSVLVCDKPMLLRLIRLYVECPSLRHIICMDPIPETILGMEKNELCIHYMNDIETCGSNQCYDFVNIAPDECFTIIYTSGSSGIPKGAMISERTFRAAFAEWCVPFTYDFINFSYEPLAWASDRDSLIRTFLLGGRTGFSTGDVSYLMEELALVRPNSFLGTPAIWNKIYA